MDKREEDILDDILDGEESEEIIIPETLRGEPDDETETEVENAENKEEIFVDLSSFLDDNTEIEDLSEISLDPELEKVLEAFSDDGSAEKKPEEITKLEISPEEKAKKFKFFKNIAIICVAAVLVIGGGIFAFLQINKYNSSYIMTFENKKISVEEFKLFLLFNQNSENPKESAVAGLKEFLILAKAAEDKKIELSEEDLNNAKSQADNIKQSLNYYGIPVPDISDERLAEIMSIDGFYYKLFDKVAEEANFTVDETAFAAEFESYRQSDKLLKYVIVESEEQMASVKDIITSGSMPVDEIIMQYSVDYSPEDGISKFKLSQLYQMGFTEEELGDIMSMKESDISNTIDLGGAFVVFIVAPMKEAEDDYRAEYAHYKKQLLFETEYSFWEKEYKIKINDKVFDKFDAEEYFNSFAPVN